MDKVVVVNNTTEKKKLGRPKGSKSLKKQLKAVQVKNAKPSILQQWRIYKSIIQPDFENKVEVQDDLISKLKEAFGDDNTVDVADTLDVNQTLNTAVQEYSNPLVDQDIQNQKDYIKNFKKADFLIGKQFKQTRKQIKQTEISENRLKKLEKKLNPLNVKSSGISDIKKIRKDLASKDPDLKKLSKDLASKDPDLLKESAKKLQRFFRNTYETGIPDNAVKKGRMTTEERGETIRAGKERARLEREKLGVENDASKASTQRRKRK
jgi:hypothetical protein